MSRRQQTFGRRSRDRPLGTQLVVAFVAILIAVAVIGAAASAFRGHDDRRGSTAAPTTTVARGPRPSVPTSSSSLIPLSIASPSHTGSYNRDDDFGGFVDIDGCKNTRAVMLIRTSAVATTFTRSSACTVDTGQWTDPWSGVITTVARDLQIDHTVPLANAWRSGAWSWTRERRVAFANDLRDPGHLVPILGHENEAKGDDGPDGWKPPMHSAWCAYALVWDRIKAKWHLSATVEEWNALVAMAATC